MMRRFRLGSMALPLALAFIAAACSDDDPVEPTPDPIVEEEVIGTYIAAGESGTIELITGEDETTDLLEAGAELEIVLGADGELDGRLFIPEWEEEEDLEVDLAGSWEIDGYLIEIAPEAETILDGLRLKVDDEGLRGSIEVDDDLILRVVVVRGDHELAD